MWCAMRVLGYVHTFNDQHVIERALRALMDQTYRLETIVLVDNASTDDTLNRSFPENVTVIRHPVNTGTSGAVATGLQQALQHGYDWLWVVDADSVPRPDALEKLVDLYTSFSPSMQEQIGILSSLCVSTPLKKVVHGVVLDSRGGRIVRPGPDQVYYECDASIWSGSMYRLEAVRRAGYPRFGANWWEDFSTDWGDLEFAFRIRRAGFRNFVHQQSVLEHPIGTVARYGGIFLSIHPARRLYLNYRNMVYFWLHIHPDRRLWNVFFSVTGSLLKYFVKILMTRDDPFRKIRACLQGIWNGSRKNMYGQFTG
jgi:GT2 family glycosyltransferase